MINLRPAHLRTPSKYEVLDGVCTLPDLKQICLITSVAGLKEYKRRTAEMAERQGNLCAICGLWMSMPTFEHARGRCSGKRDDRIVDEHGNWLNAAVDYRCNGSKGSRIYGWNEKGEYEPI